MRYMPVVILLHASNSARIGVLTKNLLIQDALQCMEKAIVARTTIVKR